MLRNTSRVENPAVATGGAHRKPRRWWRRPWVIPLAVLMAAFLLHALPPYLTLDPDDSRSVLNISFPPHYALLLAHIGFGTIATVTVCLQVWPWLRRRHPAVHRASGRVYVFAGMLPAGALALVIAPFTSLVDVAKVGAAAWGLGGLITTIMGWRMARRRRYADHRRWMLYSFAYALTPISGRAMFYPMVLIPGLGPDDLRFFGGIVAFWGGWIVNLLLVRWWLARRGPVGLPGLRPTATLTAQGN
jgi:hypothetical protein